LFKEPQIFRIDHYLAKETIQNILSFRFANSVFEPLLDKEHVERVSIALYQEEDVSKRGSFYDGVGELRDMGQNHMLQMLALIAMEDPKVLASETIREERARVLSALRPVSKLDAAERVTRGQYAEYRKHKGVASDSKTETFFSASAYIDNDRWQGVPFNLISGKGVGESSVEITITFRERESCVCPAGSEAHYKNVLTIRIQPDEGISMKFWVKKPGFTMDLEPRTLSFMYKDSPVAAELPEAYERVLYDCIRGDQTLFPSTQEVDAAWEFITSILENWEGVPLTEYEKGNLPKK
jgi:glucose-6-phosphate 1-dehydrogenase